MNLLFAIPAAIAAFRLIVNQAQPGPPAAGPHGHRRRHTGLFALVYGFSNSETHSWGHPITIVALAPPSCCWARSW